MSVVGRILNEVKPNIILDTPCGNGWLKSKLNFEHTLDGLDLFEDKPNGYENFSNADLDYGIPNNLGKYDAIVTCEGIEHVGNPLLLLTSAKEHLRPEGILIVTTPNTWYPGSKLKYILNGFFPSFPCLAGKIKRGNHMHIMPWTFPQLYLYLKLAGYSDIKLYDIPEKKPKHFFEYLIGLPQKLYCQRKKKKSIDEEEKQFWEYAGSLQSVFGRRLVVSARYSK